MSHKSHVPSSPTHPESTLHPAAILGNKLALRECLGACGIPNPHYRAAKTLEEAIAAGREIGMPVIVKPADSSGGAGIRQVDHIEDMPLAFARAMRASPAKTALLESLMTGEVVCFDGVMRDEAFVVRGTLSRKRAGPPFCFDEWISAPAALSPNEHDAGRAMVAAALAAAGVSHGPAHADVIFTPDGPRVLDMATHPACSRFPADVIRMAAGEDTNEKAGGAAIHWIPTRSGIVKEIRGIDAARALPGVKDVVVAVQPGDTMRHVMDSIARDRVGYVLAIGANGREAIDIARRAVRLCEIVTCPTC